jgi:flagellar basal-body rod protein FlgB
VVISVAAEGFVVSIFSVVSQHVDWLSQRYAVTARNVANIDTPGFKAQQIENFKGTFDNLASLQMVRTQPGHVTSSTGADSTYDVLSQKNAETKVSGNDVSIDKEMQAVGDTSRQFAADLNLERLFQRMYISSLRG